MTVEVLVADTPAPHVVMRGTGLITSEDLGRMFEETLKQAAQIGSYRILADLVEMDARHSLSDLYWIVRALEERNVPRGDFREALLVRRVADAGEHVEFFELAARNRGYDVRLFEARDAALEWLAAPRLSDRVPPPGTPVPDRR